ncbi:MAG: NAD(P)H-hydrate dehydratase [Ruminococcaceae bacterium]|nr:NAD(P)H-hydrate dehydratase [Oscillospiraceae bacterium]
MQPILTAAEMRCADERTVNRGLTATRLMERAARNALRYLMQNFDTSLVLFLCGGGNNGGDGVAMARLFAEQGGVCRLCYLGKLTEQGAPDPRAMSKECAYQFSLLPPQIPIISYPDLKDVTVAVDAMLGIGLSRPLSSPFVEAIAALAKSGVPVLSIDIPTGVCADSGMLHGCAVRATKTLAIAAKKRGHVLYPGLSLCGSVEVTDIGIEVESANAFLLERTDLDTLPKRPERSHKGTFGRILTIGGSIGMSGAALLAAKAAYRAGAGLVEIFTPYENREIYQIALPEAVLTLYSADRAREALADALRRADAVAIGMGLSVSETAKELVRTALELTTVPLVVDADALNAIAADPALLALLYARTAPTVLTPHLGEMSRLAGKSVAELMRDLPEHARSFAAASGTVTVLKDARTVISDGKCCYLNPFGNNGMSTAGSGDVLAGTIAALAATELPLDAAVHGVLVHALAGDAAAKRRGRHGLMASDIIDGICEILD